MSATPATRASEAAAVLREMTGLDRVPTAVVLGSGWEDATDLIGTTVAEFPVTDVPHFSPPSVQGHAGRVRLVETSGSPVIVFLGRTHLYEGRGVHATTHCVRTLGELGVEVLILTNGCGGLDPRWVPGTPVIISDHINLTGESPLEGPSFVDLTEVYSSRLRALCHELDPSLDEGTYVQFRGPMYETPAEIRMVRAIGGTLVGMSTALEAIVARSLGIEILGLSLVTNLAAGMSGQPLHHAEVVQSGRASASKIGTLLSQVISAL